jgi:hypothetical protein
VPAIGTSCGAPSIGGSGMVSLRLTAAVCGIAFSIIATCACGVPGTEASTGSTGLSSGIRRKSSGSLEPGT